MHLTTRTSKNRPHVKPQDRYYHEEIGLRMTSIYFVRHKTKKEYHYGDVSYLKLLDEGKLPPDPGEELQRDLDIYRLVTREHAATHPKGGVA